MFIDPYNSSSVVISSLYGLLSYVSSRPCCPTQSWRERWTPKLLTCSGPAHPPTTVWCWNVSGPARNWRVSEHHQVQGLAIGYIGLRYKNIIVQLQYDCEFAQQKCCWSNLQQKVCVWKCCWAEIHAIITLNVYSNVKTQTAAFFFNASYWLERNIGGFLLLSEFITATVLPYVRGGRVA